MIGRFAPSPTGRMHLGNIWVALLSDLAVHACDGQQILRIEDLDLTRSSEQYTLQLAADLAWLGLAADIGQPPEPMIRQSERTGIYHEIFEKWRLMGRTYPCYCSRADLLAASAPHIDDGHRIYSGNCRPASIEKMLFEQNRHDPAHPKGNHEPTQIQISEPVDKVAWRLAVEPVEIKFTDRIAGPCALNLEADWGDFIIRRADGGFAYQLACAVDDALMGIDLVVRGRDLLRSTFPQIYIFHLLGQKEPAYAHVPLLIDLDGHRLSKRQQSLDIGALQAAGFSAEKLIGYLAFLAGLIDRPEPVSARELRHDFSLSRINNHAAIEVDQTALYRLI